MLAYEAGSSFTLRRGRDTISSIPQSLDERVGWLRSGYIDGPQAFWHLVVPLYWTIIKCCVVICVVLPLVLLIHFSASAVLLCGGGCYTFLLFHLVRS